MVMPTCPVTNLEQVHRPVKHDPLCPSYSNCGCTLAASLVKRLKPLCAGGIMPVYLREPFHILICLAIKGQVMCDILLLNNHLPRQTVWGQKQNDNVRFVYEFLSFRGGSCPTACRLFGYYSVLNICFLLTVDQSKCVTRYKNPKYC
jgi:hypothetical protein